MSAVTATGLLQQVVSVSNDVFCVCVSKAIHFFCSVRATSACGGFVVLCDFNFGFACVTSNKVAGKSGKKSHGSGFKVFWIPGGKKSNHNHHHKHKKDKPKQHTAGSIGSQRGPVAEAAGTAALHRAMMSGDSPDINHPPPKDALLDPKDALALHDLTNAACSSKTDVLQASILVDPHNNKAAICPQVSPIEQRTKATSTTDESIESAADNPMLPRKLQNGTLDTTDLALNTHIGEKQKDDKVDDDDSCGVKCLYYSLQCCECTIM